MDNLRLLTREELSQANVNSKKAEPQIEELLLRFLASLQDEAQGGRADECECTEAAD